MALSNDALPSLGDLSNEQLGQLFRCSATIVQRVKTGLSLVAPEPRKPGRRTILSEEDEHSLVECVKARSSRSHWVSMREFKFKVVEMLEEKNIEKYPSRHFYGDLVKRLLGDEYEKKSAETLEPARANVTEEDVKRYFEILQEEELEHAHPDLIINVDETGFGSSRSGRLKPTKVIVPKTAQGRLFVGSDKEYHYISAICGVTAGGKLLPPAVITKRKTLPEDVWHLPIGQRTRIFCSEKAFVTRRIFQTYIRETLLPYIQRTREKLGDNDLRAYVIWDGHSSHYDDITGAVAAVNGVSIIALPPHGSHLTQPLDREFFLKVKQFYSFYTLRSDISKISATILRVMQSIFSAGIPPIIINSWAMTGIVPIVRNGCVARIELSPPQFTLPQRNENGEQESARQSRRRVDTTGPGLLNADQQLFLEANVCPFCMRPLAGE